MSGYETPAPESKTLQRNGSISFYGDYTKIPEPGESRLNPVPFGSSLAYGDEKVTVLGSQRLSQIGTGWLPDIAKEGYIYLVVQLKVDFLGDPSKSHHLYKSDFDVVGSSGYVYEYEWLLLNETHSPLKEGEFYGGATTSGDLIYETKQNETNLVLVWHCSFSTDRFLEIP